MITKHAHKAGIPLIAALVMAAGLFGGCAADEPKPEPTTAVSTPVEGDYEAAAISEAKKLAEGQKLVESIEFIGSDSGVEGEALEKLYKAFTDGSGVAVRYNGTKDADAIIQSRVQAGNPPNVAVMQIGNAFSYAKEGKLTDLGASFGDELKKNFEQALLDDASYEGKVIGVYQGFNNFMVWYNPKTYSGPANPTSWQEMVEWTKAQGDAGSTAWCAAENAGAATGFPGQQMLENLFLKKYGPDKYREWGEGKLAWTSPEVKDAFKMFGEVFGNDKYVAGGVAGSLADPIATGYNGLTADPPTCQAALWADWVPGLIGDTAVPGETIDFVRVPASDPQWDKAEMFQAAIVAAFTDDATTMTFLKWLQSTPAQAYLASLNQWPVANKNVAPETYSSATLQKISATYFGSSGMQLAVGPNLLDSADTANAFYAGVVSYLQKPDQLDKVLEGIQATVK
jgi:alpha-glucoside transport system substrate-binding protein